MPTIDLSILNQRQTPAFYADVFANRPAAGYIGRIFVSTDTFAFYRDNGTGWDLIGGPGTGTITGTGASGQIALWDGASTISGDTGLTYDGTDNSLTASKFIVTGGTSSQFLKADGSVDSSSYVPYTGATASLDLGANNLLGQNFFVRGDDISNGGFLGFKQFNGTSSGQTGYTSISALQQNSLYFQFSQTNGTNKTFELSAGLLGTTARQFQFPDASGTIALTSNLSSYVPYTGATANVDLGAFDLTADLITGATGSFTSSGGSNTFGITHTSGSGIALNISKDGNGEGLFITKGSGTGNAATINGGLVRIENNSGDAQLQIVSSSAPSVRIDNASTGATKRAGLGISTAVNNFIQGSADRDYCIFNSSTTASPILFGVYDAGLTNTQEAARISPARNFLVGTTTDAGQKLQVNGTALISGNTTVGVAAATTNVEFNLNGVSGKAQRIHFKNSGTDQWLLGPGAATETSAFELYNASGTIVLSVNKSTNAATFSNSLYVNGSSAADSRFIVQGDSNNYAAFISQPSIYAGSYRLMRFYTGGNITMNIDSPNGTDLNFNNQQNGYIDFRTNATQSLRISNAGNTLLGGTTDAGQRLQVQGNIKATGNFTFNTYGNIQNATGSIYNGTATVTINNTSVNGNIQINVSAYGNGAGSQSFAMWLCGGFGGSAMSFTEITRVNTNANLTISALTSNVNSLTFTITYAFVNAADININVISCDFNQNVPTITIV